MMRRFQSKTNSFRGKQSRNRLGLSIGIVLFLALGTLLAKPLAGLFHTIARPLWTRSIESETLVSQAGNTFLSKKELLEQNVDLEEKIHEIELLLLDRKVLEDRVEDLEQMLGRAPEGRQPPLARILRRPQSSPYDTLIIDVGFNEEVEKGDLVFVGENIVIGNVTDVFSRSSKVELFSTSDYALDVVVGTDVPGKAIGKGGGNFEIDLPRGVEVAVGDTIIVPGAETMLLGVVDILEVEPSDSFQRILFRSPVNFFLVQGVQIRKPLVEEQNE